MSESVKRRNSSRQLLQNLIRVTAQRNLEDAEEVERERRRRARVRPRGDRSPSSPESPQHNNLTHSPVWEEELKPSCCLVLEEDEGFSDWSHRLDKSNEQEVQDISRARDQRPSTAQRKPDHEEEKRQEDENHERWEPERSKQSQEATPPEKVCDQKKEMKMSYSSTVFQDVRPRLALAPPDRMSYLAAGKMRQHGGTCQADGEVEQEVEEEEEEECVSLQREKMSKEILQSPKEEEEQEEEELRFTEEEIGALCLRREETFREKEQDKEILKLPEERLTESRERSEETNVSAVEHEEPLNCYGPMSPTFKKLLIQFYPEEVNSRISAEGACTIIERTESLRKSTNSLKKTPSPVSVSKIDKRLEQYAHAIELSSKEGRSGSQTLMDLMNPTEPVASKKNLFEAGEAWNQSSMMVTPSKDADGLKVGVAGLINQWVKGGEDVSRSSSPSKPADSSTGKRYKFVVTGHGKYEKVAGDKSCSEYSRCQSGEPFHDDL